MFTQSVLLTELDKTTARVESLIKQLKALHEAYQYGQKQIADLTAKNEVLHNELSECRELMALQQEEADTVKTEIQALRARHKAEMDKVNISADTERDALRSRLEAERDEVRSSLQNRLDEQRAQFEKDMAETLSLKEGEIESLRAQLASDHEAHQLQLKQNRELQQYVDGMRTQVEYVRDQVVRILENLPKAV